MDEKNSSNSMIVKDILNEFPFDKSEIKEDPKEIDGIPLSRVIDLKTRRIPCQIPSLPSLKVTGMRFSHKVRSRL